MVEPVHSPPVASRRGILLAGGAGTRLDPMTRVISKQLLPIFDKPMVHYSLSVLMMAGVREVLVISTPRDLAAFQYLLGTGEELGLQISYQVQERPEGIAQAFVLGREFVEGHPSVLILGDNLFFGQGLSASLLNAAGQAQGATVFAYRVADPERYGVLDLDDNGAIVDIIEKPSEPPSPFAVTGLYFFDEKVGEMASRLEPSARGELEITDLNRMYLASGALEVEHLGRGVTWMDTGTPEALLDAANFIHSIQERQGLQIGCLGEIAWRQGFIDTDQLIALSEEQPNAATAEYLQRLARSEVQCAS
ncbi:MAG: glucose-1-phosphate thymidylyltransferase RfbA [Acidobacteriota bacterium]